MVRMGSLCRPVFARGVLIIRGMCASCPAAVSLQCNRKCAEKTVPEPVGFLCCSRNRPLQKIIATIIYDSSYGSALQMLKHYASIKAFYFPSTGLPALSIK